MVEIRRVEPADPRARFCASTSPSSTGASRRGSIRGEHLRRRRRVAPAPGLMLVATLRDEPVGCGAPGNHRDAPTELKRMWVASSTRGLGIGRRLLTELEAEAARHGGRVASGDERPQEAIGAVPGPPATRRSRRSTTSRTPTTGSRSASGEAPPRVARQAPSRPTTNQIPWTGSSPRFQSRCGSVESNAIESPGSSSSSLEPELNAEAGPRARGRTRDPGAASGVRRVRRTRPRRRSHGGSRRPRAGGLVRRSHVTPESSSTTWRSRGRTTGAAAPSVSASAPTAVASESSCSWTRKT